VGVNTNIEVAEIVIPIEPALMTPDDVAAILQVPTRTLERWRTERRGPRFGRFGRHVRYRRHDIQEFMDRAFGPAYDEWQAS
jgi:excisionase family DNA binding protein